MSMIAFGTPVALLYSYHTIRAPKFSPLAGFSLFTALIFTLPFLWFLATSTVDIFR